MKRFSFWLTALLLTVLCAALVLSAIFCMTSAFGLPTPPLLPLLAVVCCAVFCTAFSTPKGWLAFLAFSALLLAGFFIDLKPIRESFSALSDYLIGIYNGGYHWFSGADFPTAVTAESIRTALICLCVAMSLLIGFSAAYLKSTLLCGVFVLPCFISCFVLTDTPPKTAFLLTVLFCVMLLAFSQRCRKTDVSRSPAALLWFAVPAALLLAVLCIAAPQEKYDHKALVGGIREKITDAWEEVRGGENTASGLNNPETVDLHTQRVAPASNRTVMRVSAEQTQTLYLAGVAYAGFSGDQWTVFRQARQTAVKYSAISALPQKLTVSTVRVADVLYVPYGLVQCNADTGNYDAYRENGQGLSGYTVMFYPTDNTAFWVSPSEQYSELVRSTCLELPEDTKDALLLWGRTHLPESPTPEQIADAVRQSADYSRYPKAIPGDTDLAVYFLNEAETGFCIHFATATAELLRAYGYPSRYVTGYLVAAKAGETVEVPEKNAHAWAEYYDTDRGWVLLEATPEERAARQPTETRPQITTGEVTEEETTAPTQPDTAPTRPQDSPTEKARTADSSPAWLWGLLSVGLLLMFLLLRRAVVCSVRKRKLQSGSENARICARWRYYKKLCRLSGTEPEKDLYALAQKAEYSPYRSTAEEQERFDRALGQQKELLQNAPIPKRWYVKYLLAAL